MLGIQQALQALVQSQRAPATVPTVALPRSSKPVRDELVQRATPNTDHLSAARRPMSVDVYRTIFVTKAEVAALVRQEKERMSFVATCLSLKPPHPTSIAMKQYPVGYTMPNFQKFDGRK